MIELRTKKLYVMLYGFVKYNNLLRELVVRDIKVRYRKSVLGLLWTLLYPLMTMLVMTAVFSSIFRMDIQNFAVYFLTGSILFSFNSEATSQALLSVISNASLLRKVYIPKYLFPLSRVLSALVNLGFAFAALLLVMLITKAAFYPTLFLMVLPIFYLILFTTGLGLILSSVTVFFRDVGHLYGILSMLWMYMTPLFYPVSIIPEKFKWIYEWNPMYYYTNYARSLILEGQMPGLWTDAVCLGCGLLMLLAGLIVFYRTQDRFILYI